MAAGRASVEDRADDRVTRGITVEVQDALKKAQPAFWALANAKIPDGTSVAPGTRLRAASAFTSSMGRCVELAMRRDQFVIAMLHSSTITPRSGVVASLLVGRFAETMLYGVRLSDPMT